MAAHFLCFALWLVENPEQRFAEATRKQPAADLKTPERTLCLWASGCRAFKSTIIVCVFNSLLAATTEELVRVEPPQLRDRAELEGRTFLMVLIGLLGVTTH